MEEKYAVIVAGGSGTRLGGEIPKQFRMLCGRPVLWWSVKAFHDEDPSTKVVVVLNRDFMGEWDRLSRSLPENERFPHEVCSGGSSRTESVGNGLAMIPEDGNALVAVHDGARPLVSPAMIRRGWEAARLHGAAVPAVAVTDSLRRLSPDGNEAVDRNEYVAVQTPQVFRVAVLKNAYACMGEGTFTDDASVTEAAGNATFLFEGDTRNMKVTNPGDLEIAEVLIKTQTTDKTHITD